MRESDPVLKSRLVSLENSKYEHGVEMIPNNDLENTLGNRALISDRAKQGQPDGSTIHYDPARQTSNRGEPSSARGQLAHELLGHSYDADKGTLDTGSISDSTGNSIRKFEVRAVIVENIFRQRESEPQRTTYNGLPIPPELLNRRYLTQKIPNAKINNR